MARLNLTLDDDTLRELRRHADVLRTPAAGLARELIREGIRRREVLARRQQLARDYAAGRKDARVVLQDHEAGQFDLLSGRRPPLPA